MDYLRFGKEDSEKFVILPGLALKSVMGLAEGIISAYALIAEKYDVYLFDHVRVEPEGYGISDMADDTLAAFDELGLDHVHLMGVSTVASEPGSMKIRSSSFLGMGICVMSMARM